MYETNDHRPAAKNTKSLSIRLPEFAPDKRAEFVSSVCASLIDSRFGPGRSRPLVTRLSEWPEIEDALFYEMTPTGPVPCYTILPDSEMARRYSNDIIRRELTSPPPYTTIVHISRTGELLNRGRGSP